LALCRRPFGKSAELQVFGDRLTEVAIMSRKWFKVSGLAAAAALSASIAHAQVSIDMTRVTCEQYMGLPIEQTRVFNAWMSGWFNQKSGSVSVDLNVFARNVDNVRKWCASNPRESVMAGLTRATQRQ
jgi:hypothetical protein